MLGVGKDQIAYQLVRDFRRWRPTRDDFGNVWYTPLRRTLPGRVLL